MAQEINAEQWLAELARLGVTSEDKGLTTRELSAVWKLESGAVRRRLRIAQDKGYLRNGRKMTRSVTGRMQSTDCYWFEAPKAKKR